MQYFKKICLLLSFIVLLGCSSDDNADPVMIVVTGFDTSYSQVTLHWTVNKPNDVIIQDLQVYRLEKNDNSDFSQPQLIANLPSNETVFTDNSVPYKSEVTYIIKINCVLQDNQGAHAFTMESEPKIFVRDLIKFDQVPSQVQRDPIQSDIYHILDNSGSVALKKYNSFSNTIETEERFTNGWGLYNKFHQVNNEIYVAATNGKIRRFNAQTYETIEIYNTTISDHLNAFAIDGDRIYYQDDEIWKYYTISTGNSTSTGIGMSIDYAETISSNTFLFLFAEAGSGSVMLEGFSPQNCTSSNCQPDFMTYPEGYIFPPTQSIDPNIFAWNPTKQKFISSYNGYVFSLSNLHQEIKLSAITGKHYFQFVYDNDGNIYGSVQGEKIIHKFNSNYQLIETIHTKLYPLFPMITSNGLKVVGAYEPISYWGFVYGNEFNFNVKCAIETF